MNINNSQQLEMIRPEDVMKELGIQKDTYYKDVKFLGIESQRDEDGRVYLTPSQLERIRALRAHVEENGTRNGFEGNSIVKTNDSSLSQSEEDIYVEPDDPTSQFDPEQLMRAAAELKARELAMPHLVKREIANRMTEDDLPDDLKKKVTLVREAANPKYTPAEVASTMLNQWRCRSGN